MNLGRERGQIIASTIRELSLDYLKFCLITRQALDDVSSGTSFERDKFKEKLAWVLEGLGLDMGPRALGLREHSLETAQLFYSIGEMLAGVYDCFLDWGGKQIVVSTSELAVQFSGRDSLPFFIRAGKNPGMSEYYRFWVNLGRGSLSFLKEIKSWENPPWEFVENYLNLLGGRRSLAVIDFGYGGSVDRALMVYLLYLRDSFSFHRALPNLEAVLLFYKSKFAADPETVYARTPVWGVPGFDELRRRIAHYDNSHVARVFGFADRFFPPYEEFLSFLQELGAGVVETGVGRLTGRVNKEPIGEKAYLAHPVQILLGRLAFLQAMRDTACNPAADPKKVMDFLWKMHKQYGGLFATLVDVSLVNLDLFTNEEVQRYYPLWQRLDKTLINSGFPTYSL